MCVSVCWQGERLRAATCIWMADCCCHPTVVGDIGETYVAARVLLEFCLWDTTNDHTGCKTPECAPLLPPPPPNPAWPLPTHTSIPGGSHAGPSWRHRDDRRVRFRHLFLGRDPRRQPPCLSLPWCPLASPSTSSTPAAPGSSTLCSVSVRGVVVRSSPPRRYPAGTNRVGTRLAGNLHAPVTNVASFRRSHACTRMGLSQHPKRVSRRPSAWHIMPRIGCVSGAVGHRDCLPPPVRRPCPARAWPRRLSAAALTAHSVLRTLRRTLTAHSVRRTLRRT